MAKTMRERFIAALTAAGETKVKVTSKYDVFTRKDGGFYYIGRAGALRFGKNITDSIPASDARKKQLLDSLIDWKAEEEKVKRAIVAAEKNGTTS
jgi:hypothetical protein